ncbi:unnamed protein product [Brachionus calyciflorus]|uniref:HAT C-terminal dimerisation domain-containing protein n=1 Tax=Brachionus calyciflorus TaxID=104777 RepID=A0A814GB58_9BILA|nr:unnamed protein product [Brachionus calyciflorus]
MSKDNTIDPKIFYFEELSEKLIISIKQRFKDVLEDQFYYICSMLDPNYGIIWIKPQEKSYWIDNLKTLVEEFDDNQTLSDMTEKNSKNKKNSQDNWTISYDDESFTQSNLEYDVLIKLFFETQKQSRALHRENEKGHIDPLQWWKFNQEKFLSLAKIAKKFLAVPASSGSIERYPYLPRCQDPKQEHGRNKAKETNDEYYGNWCHPPNLKRKREESQNTVANRKLLKEEMSKRDLGPKLAKVAQVVKPILGLFMKTKWENVTRVMFSKACFT